MIALAWLFGLITAIVVIAVAVAFLNRFYRKSTRDVALVQSFQFMTTETGRVDAIPASSQKK